MFSFVPENISLQFTSQSSCVTVINTKWITIELFCISLYILEQIAHLKLLKLIFTIQFSTTYFKQTKLVTRFEITATYNRKMQGIQNFRGWSLEEKYCHDKSVETEKDFIAEIKMYRECNMLYKSNRISFKVQYECSRFPTKNAGK